MVGWGGYVSASSSLGFGISEGGGGLSFVWFLVRFS